MPQNTRIALFLMGELIYALRANDHDLIACRRWGILFPEGNAMRPVDVIFQAIYFPRATNPCSTVHIRQMSICAIEN